MKDKSPTNRDNERTMKLIYVAHKFGGDLRNADRADRLTAELNLRINGAVFICPWLPMVRHWPYFGDTLARGLKLDLASVKRCDGILALTPLLTGVKSEWDTCTGSKLHFEDVEDCGAFSDYAADTIQTWVDSIGVF